MCDLDLDLDQCDLECDLDLDQCVILILINVDQCDLYQCVILINVDQIGVIGLVGSLITFDQLGYGLGWVGLG